MDDEALCYGALEIVGLLLLSLVVVVNTGLPNLLQIFHTGLQSKYMKYNVFDYLFIYSRWRQSRE